MTTRLFLAFVNLPPIHLLQPHTICLAVAAELVN